MNLSAEKLDISIQRAKPILDILVALLFTDTFMYAQYNSGSYVVYGDI